jgi:hypothetical protein
LDLGISGPSFDNENGDEGVLFIMGTFDKSIAVAV